MSRAFASWALLLCTNLCLFACERLDVTPRASSAPSASGTPVSRPAPSTPRPRLTPLASSWLETLELDDAELGPASVSVPVGTTEPRPVVVALHGHGDRPEWACGEWRGITRAHPFVLCPHGVPARASKSSGLSFGTVARTRREIDLGLSALERRFPGYVARGPLVLVGFSLGAIQGSTIVSAATQRFPLAMLAEGGVSHWTAERLREFREAGGRRLVFACSTRGCEAVARRGVALAEREGVSAKLSSAGNVGHLVDDRVVRAFRPEFAWLVADDARFAGMTASP
jgi:hypothetical protein